MPEWTKEQKLAIDKEGSNIIVSAGAGSGKTAVLTERVIRKLNEGVSIDELLILTFTEAAAKEMKDRIRRAIVKNESLKKNLELIDSAYITTFDSYALSVVKKYYYLLNISPNIKICDENILFLKKSEILDDIFEDYYRENDELFIKLITDYTNKNDTFIKNNILSINNKLDSIINKEEFLDNYFSNYTDEDIDKYTSEYNNLLIRKINSIKNLIHSLSFFVENTYIEKLNNELKNLLNSKTYNEVKTNCEIKLPSLPKNSSEEAKAYKELIKSMLDSVKKLCTYENEEEIKSSILKTKDYVKVVIDILKRLDNEINEFKKENELYDFLDIELLAIKVLKENKEVAKSIKESLNEIMIDEYQDTNDIQEEFISYISNNNVYMVGDIKQSIYRFRNANPYIFKSKYDNYKDGNGFKIDLNKNFRSREEVLDGINKIFSKIMDDSIGGASYIDSHQMIFGNLDYNNNGKVNQNNNLDIYNYTFDKESGFSKEEYEAFIVANDIKEKMNNEYLVYDRDLGKSRKAKYNDFVILIDKSKDFDLYKKIFEYYNIPLSILKDEDYKDDIILTIIKNLINLTIKYKNNEIDSEYKHSLVSIMRSFLFEIKDNEILNMFINKNFTNNEVINIIKEINIDSMSTSMLINTFIDKFNIYENLIKVGNINSSLVVLEYLINKSSELSELGYTINDFNNYLNDVIDNNLSIKFSVENEASDSVKIMTIHKSKGLEYSICYFPELFNKFNLRDLNDNILFDRKYGIVMPYFDDGLNNSIVNTLLKDNYIKEEIGEKIRLFYVSLTRAKEKMIMICDLSDDYMSSKDENGLVDEDKRLTYSSFKDIIESIKEDFNSNIKEIKTDYLTNDYKKVLDINVKIDETNNIITVNEIDKDDEILNEKHFSKDLVKLNTKEEIENMKFGTYMHYLLETIDFYKRDISFVDEKYKDKLIKFLDLDIIKDLDGAKVYKEYEFIEIDKDDENHGIIDLMIERKDYIDIIDYKLKNVADESYLNQLNGYKNFITKRFNKKVNIYLYSIIDEKLYNLDNKELVK